MERPFPVEVQEFDSDDRISFSKLDQKFIAVHDDGSEFEFEFETKKWIPIEDDHPAEDGHPAENGHHENAAGQSPMKRKVDDTDGSESKVSKPARPAKKQKPPPPPKLNTAVYVTGLPLDTQVSEVHEVFSRKGGVIAEEIDSGAPRIKLYTDSDGNFKGDALVVFFKPQSVEMAIMLLDDTDFRITSSGTSEGRIRVQAADSSYKKTQYDDNGEAKEKTGSSQPGEKRPQRNDRDRQKIIKKTQKMDAKLADWDDDDPYQEQAQTASKWDKMVVLRHMFTLQELEEDPSALLEIKEDIREECSKLGQVTNVVLYDLEPQGIVRVKFSDTEAAEACIRLMQGRRFGGRTVEASLATAGEKFKKSDKEEYDGDSD